MYEYRHVILPKEIAKKVPKGRLLTEHEWRHLGVQQSLGWVHFMIHEPGINKISNTKKRNKFDFF
jgi:cyclin-dependent kinase regulatory subunit CKS1